MKQEVEHVARKYNIAVSTVHASYTSKMCPICGCIEDKNRPNQETFECIECGYIERYAVSLAKIPDIMGDDFYKQHELEILQDFNKCVADYTWEKTHLVKYEKLLPLMDRIKIMLEEKWKISPSRLEQLYSFREKSEYADQSKQGILPRIDLGMIYNPVVQRSLTVLRHLVNELRKSEKIDENTHIHLELAREINNKSSNRRLLATVEGL